jgi:hypothetical protein
MRSPPATAATPLKSGAPTFTTPGGMGDSFGRICVSDISFWGVLPPLVCATMAVVDLVAADRPRGSFAARCRGFGDGLLALLEPAGLTVLSDFASRRAAGAWLLCELLARADPRDFASG